MSKFKNEAPAKTMLHQSALDALKLTGAKRVVISFDSHIDPVYGFGCDGTVTFMTEQQIKDQDEVIRGEQDAD